MQAIGLTNSNWPHRGKRNHRSWFLSETATASTKQQFPAITSTSRAWGYTAWLTTNRWASCCGGYCVGWAAVTPTSTPAHRPFFKPETSWRQTCGAGRGRAEQYPAGSPRVGGTDCAQLCIGLQHRPRPRTERRRPRTPGDVGPDGIPAIGYRAPSLFEVVL